MSVAGSARRTHRVEADGVEEVERVVACALGGVEQTECERKETAKVRWEVREKLWALVESDWQLTNRGVGRTHGDDLLF